MLEDCDKKYVDPPIVTNYDAPEEFHTTRWVLPPKDEVDIYNSNPTVTEQIQAQFGYYENGAGSEYGHRGFFLIFNHENFSGRYKSARRRGTAHDVNKLRKIMIELGFKVRVYEDKGAVEDCGF